MRMKPFNREVLYPDEPIVTLARADAAQFGLAAAANDRHRMRLCAHDSPENTLHEMIVALTNDAYVRPHKHFNKAESFHVIEGRGESRVGDRTLVWDRGDTFVAPPWHWITHDNPTGAPACLFQFNDEPAMRALGLFHEET